MTVAKNKKQNKQRTKRPHGPLKLYVLESVNRKRTYVGVAKDPFLRLRKHNRQIKGGARATAGQTWRLRVIVSNFSSDNAALSVEHVMHAKGKKMLPLTARVPMYVSPFERRLQVLKETLMFAKKERFTPQGPQLRMVVE